MIHVYPWRCTKKKSKFGSYLNLGPSLVGIERCEIRFRVPEWGGMKGELGVVRFLNIDSTYRFIFCLNMG